MKLKLLLSAAVMMTLLAASGAYANSGLGTVACGDNDQGPGTAFVTYAPTTLWPPNHKMQTIDISYTQGCDDGICGGPISVSVDSITETEESGASGCGQPTSKQGLDWSGVGNSGSAEVEPGPAKTTAQVRAERCGSGNGRTYTIHVTCNDDGEISGADLVVTVPHN